MIATLMLDEIRKMLQSDGYPISTANSWPVGEWSFNAPFDGEPDAFDIVKEVFWWIGKESVGGFCQTMSQFC